MVDYLVVGSGISGSTIARLLSRDNGDKITVIDRRDHIAGNCYDYQDDNGITIHKFGSHIFHTSRKDVWDFLNCFTSFKKYEHKVRAMIAGEEVPIPFNIDSIHQCFPEIIAKRMESKLIKKYGPDARVPILDLMRQDDEDLKTLAQFYELVKDI